MNRSHLTAREAGELYEHWYDCVAQRVRETAAMAHGRRDRYRSDLADLRRDLGSVELRWLLEPEPEARPGTPAHAAAEADRFLAEAEQHHGWGEHKAAIVWLQQAYRAARLATELADGAVAPQVRRVLVEGPIPPRPPALEAIRADPDELDDPEGPGSGLPIPRQRG